MQNSVCSTEDCTELRRKLLKWSIGQKKIPKMKHRKAEQWKKQKRGYHHSGN